MVTTGRNQADLPANVTKGARFRARSSTKGPLVDPEPWNLGPGTLSELCGLLLRTAVHSLPFFLKACDDHRRLGLS